MRILLLSPYDAMSHQYWHQRLIADLQTRYSAEVVLVTLPPRHFSWRVRGNSLTLSQDKRVQSHYDLVIATSMTDLSALKGMAPNLATTPSVVYFHENQFAYPDANQVHQVERQITSIYSALAASALVFNSNFNLSSFLSGAGSLLAKMPDGVPVDIEAQLRQKSRVISVPIQVPDTLKGQAPQLERGLSLVWNHRWEYDKGLDELVGLLSLIKAEIPVFTCHLIGQSFRTIPPQLERAKSLLGDSLGKFGFISDRQEYLALLATADIVLSTARQEFQGIAILEAMAFGCTPVVPDSLAYTEFVPAENRYGSSEAALEMVRNFDRSTTKPPLLPADVSPHQVSLRWQQLLDELL